MQPSVLDSARQLDRAAPGQRGGVEIDLVPGQLRADTRIEGRLVLGLRERHAWRGERTGEQSGKRAAIDRHDIPPVDSSVEHI